MIGMASNPFFSSVESSFSDCPLADKAKAFAPEKIDKAALDKPMAKDPEAIKNFSKSMEGTTREPSEDEKMSLKDTWEWTDKQIAKCTIDKDGVFQYKTICCDQAGKIFNGVPYEHKVIEKNGIKVDGVFPKFESVFDTQLTPESYKSTAYAKECNANLMDAIQINPELKNKFTQEQLKDIEKGKTPTGYEWHHNEEPGKMQLVESVYHNKTIGGAAHTGGGALWGPDSVEKKAKGEQF